MLEKQIELLNKQLSKIAEVDFDVDAWKSATIVILGRIFGDKCQAIKAIENIELTGGGIGTVDSSYHWDNMVSCKKQAKDIIEACINELQTFGPPDKRSNDSGININLTQHQNQTVNINLLISALEEVLTVSQLKEIKALMETAESRPAKMKKIVDKIKSFGQDVASNILANILTNPIIWG